jgi:cation:H+ antiporter
MIQDLAVFIVSMILVIRGATLATRYSAKLAESLNLSKYTIGFIIVAFISILPETLISINAALSGAPSFGLGTLLGSNVADLTLIFALLVVGGGREMKIERKVLADIRVYPLFLLMPIVLGLDGGYSRIDGSVLIIAGGIFYYMIYRGGIDVSPVEHNGKDGLRSALLLLLAIAFLLFGSYYTVESATALAYALNINPILIGMLVVSLGTTMPELFFSFKACRKRDDCLAIGDILGAVLADATVVVGLLAFISPFSFPVTIIYATGMFMVVASCVLIMFMRSDRKLSHTEAYLLLAFWICYVCVEFTVNG